MKDKNTALHGKNDFWAIVHGSNLDDLLNTIQEQFEQDCFCRNLDIKYLNNEYVIVVHYSGKWRYE